MNGGFGPGLGTSPSPLMSGGHSLSLGRLGVRGSRTSSHGSSNSERIRPHPSYYSQPTTRAGPVGTIAPGESKWMIPLCHEPANDVNTCCLGCWCPCILYGRTQYRLRPVNGVTDSQNLTNYHVCNGPCGTFMLAQYFTCFCWMFIMMQHSRIRGTYSIEGSTADDCFSAYFCPYCTLMQDDREIRARDYKDKKKEKAGRGIIHQPSPQPEMQYGIPSVILGKPVQHRGSLLREEPITAVTGQKQGPVDHGLNGENQNGSEHSQRHLEHKQVQKTHVTDLNEHKTKEKGEMTHINHKRSASSNGSTRRDSPTHPDRQERDAILAARQNWRHQSLSGRPGGRPRPENALADGRGDGDKGGEKNHPVTTHHKVFDYSADASLSQVRGRRVLKQISKIEGHPVPSSAADLSDSPADDSVLVFYDDRDHPQRHSLADCARLRASTLDRTDTPHNDLMTKWHEEKTVAGYGLSQASELHDLAACPEVIVTEDLKPLDHQHILDDCTAEDIKKTKDVKQNHLESYSLDSFTSDMGTAKKEAAEPEGSNPDPVEQHLLKESATGSIADVTNPTLAEGISQHLLSECAENDTETVPVGSATPNQHGIAGSTSVNGAQPKQQPSLGQHALFDCFTDVNDAQSEASDDIYSTNDHPRSKPSAEQDENHFPNPTLPHHSVIIVSTPEVLEEATGEQPDQRRSKSPEIVVMSNDPTPSTEHHGAGPFNPISNNDGTSNDKDGQRQPSLASDSLRKVLRAADDVRHGKATAAEV